MNRRAKCVQCLSLVVLLLSPTSLLAEESVKKQQEQLRKVLNDSLDEFDITTNTDRSKTKGEIVFRWDNRERGSADGCTALWYDKQRRPIAVASVYPFRGSLVHEFDLIDRRANATGKRNGALFWRPPKDSVLQFKPVPNASTPSDSKSKRRLQIKSIAADYAVEMTGWKPDSSRSVWSRFRSEVWGVSSRQACARRGVGRWSRSAFNRVRRARWSISGSR